MFRLFTPLTVGSWTLPNRIARRAQAPEPGVDFWAPSVQARYHAWAAGGVGLLLTPPLSVVEPVEMLSGASSLHHEAQIAPLKQLRAAVARQQALLLPVLSHPALSLATLADMELEGVLEAFEAAAWRAWAAGCPGVMINGADRSLLQQLASPLTNRRSDSYGGRSRYALVLELVERLRRRFGPRLLIGYRMLIDELRPDGVSVQDSRVAARQLAAAGVQLLDAVVDASSTLPLANFPGWQIPLVAAVRTLVDIPVIATGGLGDPELAESVLDEGSADIVALGTALVADAQWPQSAHSQLQQRTLLAS